VANQDKTMIVLVLDASGSMSSLGNEPATAIDAFVADQKKQPGEALFTLVQFNTAYFFTHKATPLTDVGPIGDAYHPNGMTALHDATGRAIDETGKELAAMPEADRPGKVVFVVMTDGHENSSKEYTGAQVAEKIKHQTEKYGWQFLFLGAGQDAIQQGGALNVNAAQAMSWNSEKTGGVLRGLVSSSEAVSSYRGGGQAVYSNAHRDQNK